MMHPAFPHDRAAALADALRQRVDGEVRFDDGYRGLYSTDASNYRQLPIGVVLPRSIEGVETALSVCREHDAPVLSRGGGTSLAGQCCNAAVVLDMSKRLRSIKAIDADRRRAVVEPGCVLDALRSKAENYGLTFGPDPATHDHNTLGGMIGNNSCGVHALMAGRTVDNVESLDVLTYDGLRLRVGATSEDTLESYIREGGRRGEIYAGLKRIRDRHAEQIRARYPKIPRRVSGFNLDALLPENGFNVAKALVGTEGTCVAVLEAELRLVPSPPCRALVVLGYPDVYCAADHVPEILEHDPIGLEALDDVLFGYLEDKHMSPQGRKMLPEGCGWLLVEVGAENAAHARQKAHDLADALRRQSDGPSVKVYADAAAQSTIWQVRESALGATAHLRGQPDNWPGWEDAAVDPTRLGGYLREFRSLLDRYDYACSLYGHFGDGCVHTRIDFDLTSRDGIDRFKSFTAAAADLVVAYGGSLSGEHGDGQARADLLPKMYGHELVEAFREFKLLWDPRNRMNPGKVVDPYPRDSNLRLNAKLRELRLDTAFSYVSDGGSFAGAATRCVGVGKCRHMDGGVMCPSFMATREEMHSTRGRARLLYEMVYGMAENGARSDKWGDPAVHEALDLCLACKGCRRDCPVDVDMATYKSEFNYHYYARRLRPRSAYSMGWIYYWSRIAAVAPAVANFLAGAPVSSRLLKRAAGVAQARNLPRFAARTFRRRHARRLTDSSRGRRVVLWPDTFNNFQHPEILEAAVDVLEAAGYDVVVPTRSLCCARPLYAWGMLRAARRQLGAVLRFLEPEITRGTPIVGVEPACMSAFRDELPDLFPDDARAAALAKQSFMLGEFLAKDPAFEPPRIARKALVHRHCHHHASIGFSGERQVLDAAGLDYEVLDSGCCGMAGPFGFETEHYALSLQIGERVLLPAVRQASADTLIVADGYACAEQIRQTTSRTPINLAELLRLGVS